MLVDGKLDDRHRVLEHLQRATEVQRADHDRTPSRVALEQSTDHRDEYGKSYAGPALIGIEWPQLQRVLVASGIAISDQFLTAGIEVLLANLDALAERWWLWVVEDLDAAPRADAHLDAVKAWPSFRRPRADRPNLPGRQGVTIDRLGISLVDRLVQNVSEVLANSLS